VTGPGRRETLRLEGGEELSGRKPFLKDKPFLKRGIHAVNRKKDHGGAIEMKTCKHKCPNKEKRRFMEEKQDVPFFLFGEVVWACGGRVLS